MSTSFPPSIQLGVLYEKTSQRGTRYFVGRRGLARITLLPGDAAEDGTPTWRMMLQEAPRSRALTDRAASDTTPSRRPRQPRRSAASGPTDTPMHDDPVDDLWRGE